MKRGNRFIDITGNRYNRWLVLGLDCIKDKRSYWRCKCDCGNIKSVYCDSLKGNKSKSCGCLQKERASEIHKGRKLSAEHRKKLSENHADFKGENSPHCGKFGKDHPSYKHGLYNTKSYAAAATNKYRATKLNQTPENANLQKIQLYYSVCAYLNSNCEIPMWHVDHIRPISKGGLHHEDNLQILTAEINLQKSAKYPLTEEEEIKYKGIMI